MRDARRIRERVQVRVDRAQLIWVTVGLVVSLALTFAVGYVVGRRAQRIEAATAPADPIARIESNALAVQDDLRFYADLTENTTHTKMAARAPGATPAARLAPPATAPQPTTAAPLSPLEHPGPTGRATAADEALDEPAPAAAPARRERDLATAVASARVTAKSSEGRTAATPAPLSAPSEVRAALDGGPASLGEYTVQVSAFQSMAEAKAFAAGLERKGFKPFVVTSSITGRGTWYRVRIGRFTDEAAATSAKEMLASSDIPAWVLRSE